MESLGGEEGGEEARDRRRVEGRAGGCEASLMIKVKDERDLRCGERVFEGDGLVFSLFICYERTKSGE